MSESSHSFWNGVSSHLTSVGVAVVEIEADVERNAATTSVHLVCLDRSPTIQSQVLPRFLQSCLLFPVTHHIVWWGTYGAYFLLLLLYYPIAVTFTSTRAKASGLGYLSYVYSGNCVATTPPAPAHLCRSTGLLGIIFLSPAPRICSFSKKFTLFQVTSDCM